MSNGYIVRIFDVSSNTAKITEAWFADWTTAMNEARFQSKNLHMYTEVVDLVTDKVIMKTRSIK